MEKLLTCCQQIVCGAAILLGVLIGWWICQKTVQTTQTSMQVVGGTIGTAGSHQTQLSGGTCSSPAVHVSTAGPNYQSVARIDPKFCWNTMGSTTSDWKFDLYTAQNQAVGCSSGPSFLPTTTTTVQCTGVSLTANQLYKGILQYHFTDGTGPFLDSHWYKAQP